MADSNTPELPLHNVHLYLTFRIKIPNVAAANTRAAAEKAEREFKYSDHHGSEYEYAEEITAALVDVVGDDEYMHSETIEFNDGNIAQITETIAFERNGGRWVFDPLLNNGYVLVCWTDETRIGGGAITLPSETAARLAHALKS